MSVAGGGVVWRARSIPSKQEQEKSGTDHKKVSSDVFQADTKVAPCRERWLQTLYVCNA